jgi:hypothetical protein
LHLCHEVMSQPVKSSMFAPHPLKFVFYLLVIRTFFDTLPLGVKASIISVKSCFITFFSCFSVATAPVS